MGLEADSEAQSHSSLTYKQQPLAGAAYSVTSHSTFDKAHILPYRWNGTFCRLLYLAIFTFYKKKVKTWDNATLTVHIYIIGWPSSLQRKKNQNKTCWSEQMTAKRISVHFPLNKTNTVLRHITVGKTGSQLYHEADDVQASYLKTQYPFLLA